MLDLHCLYFAWIYLSVGHLQAPAVVFIDELDAVGRQRGLIGGSGGQERDSTLNQVPNPELFCLTPKRPSFFMHKSL